MSALNYVAFKLTHDFSLPPIFSPFYVPSKVHLNQQLAPLVSLILLTRKIQ